MPQIYGYALAGKERCGAARSGYTTTKLFLAVNGVQVATARAGAGNVLLESLVVTEVLNQIPNTAACTMQGTEPVEGQDVVITIGSINNPDRLFAGTLLNRTHAYLEKPANWQAPINAVDYTWHLTRRRFSGLFTNAAPAVVAAAIIAAVPGFTVTVAADLPTLDTISFVDVDCLAALTQLANRCGGYCDVDYQKVAKLFLTDASVTNPTDLTAAHASLSAFAFTRDLSQLRTRVVVEGGGVAALALCAGGETILPVGTTAWYNPLGGTVKTGPQHLTYTGVQVGGAGSIVGPGVTPSAAPNLAASVGAGVETGTHLYAYVWVTAAGKSLPSPTVAFAVGAPLAPPAAPTAVSPGPFDSIFNDGITQGAVYRYVATYSLATSATDHSLETAVSPLSAAVSPVALTNWPGHTGALFYTFNHSANPLVKWVHIYRTLANGSTYYLVQTADNAGPNYGGYDAVTDATASGHVTAPAVDSTAANQVAISGIAVGPAGTTAREIYRTTAGGAQLKLQQTIANNTATTGVTDATADGSLGANAPTGDTTGLTQALSNGGAFYSGTGITFSTNGAATGATTSPVFTSASYTFVAADVGASVYIKSGTNWTPGRYLIAAVAGGAASLVGACATVASPTAATWGVDYSELPAARLVFADLAIDATTNTKFTSAAFPVGVNFIGNVLAVAGSVGFITQRVIVVAVAGTTATGDKSLGTLSSTGGGGNLGGSAPANAVLPGSTTLIVAGTAFAVATGGWAVIGNGTQVIRYTGVSGGTLTGIPATGPGAIVAAVVYNSTITAAPALIGLQAIGAGAVLYPILQGDPVNLLVRVDDGPAQTALAALLGGGDDGIVEEFLQDGTIGETEARARGTAQLARSSRVLVSITFKTRDRNTHAGRTIHVNLGSPTSLTGDFQIQHVTIDTFQTALLPTYTVQASSNRFSLEDLLRLARAA